MAIPFNYLYRQEELAYVLAQSECTALITMTGFAGPDYLGMLNGVAPDWNAAPRRNYRTYAMWRGCPPTVHSVMAYEPRMASPL